MIVPAKLFRRLTDFSMIMVTGLMLGPASSVLAQPAANSPKGSLIIPASSERQKVPPGHKFIAHTNVRIFVPDGLNPEEAPPFGGYAYETPASIACHYGLIANELGLAPDCNPNATTVDTTGGSWRIAIVDAYDDPRAAADLATFSAQFGLPLTSTKFSVVQATTSAASCKTVPVDQTGGWELEEALDIEWSHAMAPNATIFLVEACSNTDTDLQQAVLVANNLVKCAKSQIDGTTRALGTCPAGAIGKGEVSMSWGGGEFSSETVSDNCATFNDSCFREPQVVYFASSGDSPGVEYPSASPNVVAAGGTTVRRNQFTGDWIAEAPWVSGGGGSSVYEGRPAFQATVSSVVGAARGVPDLAFDSDPFTGVWIYDSFPVYGTQYYDWTVIGGTSVASPALAGIVNKAGAFAASSQAELATIYANAATANFRDLKSGFCGFYMGYSGTTGWDFCTGVGVVNGYKGK